MKLKADHDQIAKEVKERNLLFNTLIEIRHIAKKTVFENTDNNAQENIQQILELCEKVLPPQR